MVEWLLDIYIDPVTTFPEYNELVEELKKIPDAAVITRYAEGIKPPINLTGYNVNPKYMGSFRIYYKNNQVSVAIYDVTIPPLSDVTIPPIIERRASVENFKKAVPVIVEFTRYALAMITKDAKYIKESEVVKEDISQIKAIYVTVSDMSLENIRYFENLIDFLRSEKNCETIQTYEFKMIYEYTHTAREVYGAIFCCSDQCYLRIVGESEEGEVKGNKWFVIELHGRKPSKETLEEVLKTKKDLLMKIERNIRETLEKQSQ
ncbi:MAG: hypothetical protein JZD40_03815 [Sulfolobus sp.]|nr:hypothetical protein [Sulfolobus sp.]